MLCLQKHKSRGKVASDTTNFNGFICLQEFCLACSSLFSQKSSKSLYFHGFMINGGPILAKAKAGYQRQTMVTRDEPPSLVSLTIHPSKWLSCGEWSTNISRIHWQLWFTHFYYKYSSYLKRNFLTPPTFVESGQKGISSEQGEAKKTRRLKKKELWEEELNMKLAKLLIGWTLFGEGDRFLHHWPTAHRWSKSGRRGWKRRKRRKSRLYSRFIRPTCGDNLMAKILVESVKKKSDEVGGRGREPLKLD